MAPVTPFSRGRKLPCATLSVEYGKGFTKNRLEAHDDALNADSRVVIFDDVIASGKTMVAAVELVGTSLTREPVSPAPCVRASHANPSCLCRRQVRCCASGVCRAG